MKTMQLLLRHLICFHLCMLSFSCATVSSDAKHSEWMQIKDEREKLLKDSTSSEIEIICEATNNERNIRFTDSFEIYCNELKKSLQLIENKFF